MCNLRILIFLFVIFNDRSVYHTVVIYCVCNLIQFVCRVFPLVRVRYNVMHGKTLNLQVGRLAVADPPMCDRGFFQCAVKASQAKMVQVSESFNSGEMPILQMRTSIPSCTQQTESFAASGALSVFPLPCHRPTIRPIEKSTSKFREQQAL